MVLVIPLWHRSGPLHLVPPITRGRETSRTRRVLHCKISITNVTLHTRNVAKAQNYRVRFFPQYNCIYSYYELFQVSANRDWTVALKRLSQSTHGFSRRSWFARRAGTVRVRQVEFTMKDWRRGLRLDWLHCPHRNHTEPTSNRWRWYGR